MRREIFNPFADNTDNTVSVSSGQMRSESLSIESDNVCPKCGGEMTGAKIGGHGNVIQASVKYCTKCRVTMPIADVK